MTTPTKTTHRRAGRPVPRPGPRPAAGYDVDPAAPGHQPEPAAEAAQTAPQQPKRASRSKTTREAPAAAPRRTQSAGAGTRASGKAAASSGALEKRLNLILTGEQRRWLALARVDDDIDANSRIRAMIQLWHADKELRERVDQLAHEMRS